MNKEIYTKMVLVTPEIARELLLKNSSNRPMNESTVRWYKRQMEAGQWTISGQTISISDDGRLMDGQHRLKAVILSNKSIMFNISYNIPFGSFVNYDSLRTRGVCDVFAISGITNYKSISSAISRYWLLHNNNLSYAGFGGTTAMTSTGGAPKRDKVKLTNFESLAVYERYKNHFDMIVPVSNRCYEKIKLFPPAQIAGIMAILIIDKNHNPDKVFSFFTQLFMNENVENESIYNLREKLISGEIGNYKIISRLKYIFLVKCWNAFVLGKVIKKYYFADSDVIPEFI